MWFADRSIGRGDLKYLVEDGPNGQLIQAQSVEAFAAAYESILFDKQTEDRMSRQTALQLNFSSVATLWDSLFREEAADSVNSAKSTGKR